MRSYYQLSFMPGALDRVTVTVAEEGGEWTVTESRLVRLGGQVKELPTQRYTILTRDEAFALAATIIDVMAGV